MLVIGVVLSNLEGCWQATSTPHPWSASDRVALVDLRGSRTYLGFEGGLYENSSNTAPRDHHEAGVAIAQKVSPLDQGGNPTPYGRIVFLSIGMSNALQEFRGFIKIADRDSRVNHQTLVIANGAQFGITACYWTDPFGTAGECPPKPIPYPNPYDKVHNDVLASAGVSERQVQVAWLQEANPGPGRRFRPLCDPSTSGCVNDVRRTEALRYESQLGQILRALRTRYPNLKQVFLSSRTYAGYARTELNPEPFAYEYGFSVKWLVQAQISQARTGVIDPIAGDLDYRDGKVPWVAWGPYLWADNQNARSDGLKWVLADYREDGTHPSGQGARKVGDLMMNFFLTSPYSPWFRR